MIDYSVVRACPADAEAVYELLAAAGRRLAMEGFHNWDPPYPRQRVAADIDEGAVFVVRSGPLSDLGAGALVATYALRAAPVRAYAPAPWADPDAPARYLNRLAVGPRVQGRGVGGWCLAHVATQAATEGARAVRCDVLAANVGLRRFYERAGYRVCGTRTHSGWEFACYEHRLERPAGAGSNVPAA